MANAEFRKLREEERRKMIKASAAASTRQVFINAVFRVVILIVVFVILDKVTSGSVDIFGSSKSWFTYALISVEAVALMFGLLLLERKFARRKMEKMEDA